MALPLPLRACEFRPFELQDSANLRASAFDLLRLSSTDTTAWPYQRRRAALESVFAARRLTAPWTLCPSTTNPQTVAQWLTWGSVGLEGVLFKRLTDSYRPSARGWLKYKPIETSGSLLLGRYDTGGHLHYVGRTTTLAAAAGRAIAPLLTPATADHPWTGWSFSAFPVGSAC
ncbi:hypothetical protein ACGFWE_42765 [Streptomyces sp. NPDC048523]|uniref:ATP-dependent DNA ligase n=1 Tax=Streptomyces sp. NPDC048523 TaxID=3365567 RepID=UPI00371A846B